MKKIASFLNNHYKQIVCAAIAGTILASGCATAAFSFAWFSNRNNISNDFKGQTAGAYFARGKDTKDDPYVINRPIHFYNLAWLQYVGFFKNKEPYFIIEKDLDMSGWVLPPIGTTQHPFVGHLDGQKSVIKNLKTTNDSNALLATRHPSIVTSITDLDVSGAFGVIGEKGTDYKDDANTPSVSNIYFDKLEVDSVSQKALVGLAAGYVNGNLSQVGVAGNSTLNISQNSTPYDTTLTSNLSDYTSIGYCEEKYRNKSYEQNIQLSSSTPVKSTTGGSGTGTGDEEGWGGSISMQSLTRRINYMASVSSYTYKNQWATYQSDTYHLNVGSGSSLEPYWKNPVKKPSDTTINYLNDGTYLPLNINEDTAFAGDEIPGTENSSWHTTNFYKENSNNGKGETDIILPNNTGYLVGGNDSNNSYGYIRTKMMQTSSALQNSINSGVYKFYSVNSLNDGASSIQEITDQNASETFKYSKFSKVKSEFLKLMTNSEYVHGFHFMNKINTENPSKGKYNAKISNTEFKDYEMIKGGLNFTVAQSGVITSLSGSYYPNGRESQGIFDIFEVNRDSSHNITNVKKIYKIYKKNNELVYTYDESETKQDATLCFDFTKCDSGLTAYRAYYFEFPVKAGDYVIGKKTGSAPHEADNNAYLMYLDIGANSGDEDTVVTAITQKTITDTYVCAYPKGVSFSFIGSSASALPIIDEKKGAAFILSSSFSGKVTIVKKETTSSDGTVTTSIDYETTSSYIETCYKGMDITITKNGVENSDIKKEFVGEKIQKTLMKLTYSKESKSITKRTAYVIETNYDSNKNQIGDETKTIYVDGVKSATAEWPDKIDNEFASDTSLNDDAKVQVIYSSNAPTIDIQAEYALPKEGDSSSLCSLDKYAVTITGDIDSKSVTNQNKSAYFK